MRRTATTANAVLGLLALRPSWSTWELTKQLRRNLRFFWPRAESRIYAETRRLEEKGLAHAHRSFTGRRRRTTYAISDAGREAVDEWLATPPRPTSLEAEAILRVVLSDLGTREQLFAALEQLRRDAQAILDVGSVVGPEYLHGTAPFQDQVHVRAFLFDFLSHFAFTLRDWANRTEAQVRRWDTLDDADRSTDALALIANVLGMYPTDHGPR
jgi:PadR family transcriptional regulator, regulatory protein AphA